MDVLKINLMMLGSVMLIIFLRRVMSVFVMVLIFIRSLIVGIYPTEDGEVICNGKHTTVVSLVLVHFFILIGIGMSEHVSVV